jgi:hypothetical protein
MLGDDHEKRLFKRRSQLLCSVMQSGSLRLIVNLNRLRLWFAVVCIIMVLVGLFFAFVGLGVLPVNRQVLLRWQNAVYGATFMGWGATLFFVGRLAFRRRDSELMKALLYGLFVWFPVESLFSAYFHVWFNVGVDVAVLAVLSLPLIITIRLLDETKA